MFLLWVVWVTYSFLPCREVVLARARSQQVILASLIASNELRMLLAELEAGNCKKWCVPGQDPIMLRKDHIEKGSSLMFPQKALRGAMVLWNRLDVSV